MLRLKKYRVLEYMEKAGYDTQEGFAEAIGVSRVWLSALINGRATPTTDQLVLMCQIFNCAIDDIADYRKAVALFARKT